MSASSRPIAANLRLAEEALSAARLLLEANNRYAVYQAQQAVEQLILALVQSENIHIPRHRHHQLDTMRRALPEANTFRQPLAGLTWLEAFATTYRYPKTIGGIGAPPPRDKLEMALD